ncbi:MAG: hypothetical protein KBS43_02525 [Oscillospiraceae bacterium]|nr:hypothetical protein [Candidatus Limimonas coprohippi]MCQ2488535.1 hypothetical protein [Clostridia bacterium]
MFAWLFGAETSFTKALVYNLLTGSVLMLFGAFLYSAFIGLPLAVNNIAKK